MGQSTTENVKNKWSKLSATQRWLAVGGLGAFTFGSLMFFCCCGGLTLSWLGSDNHDDAANSYSQPRGSYQSYGTTRSGEDADEDSSNYFTGTTRYESGDIESESRFNADGSYSGSYSGDGVSGRSRMNADGSGYGEYEVNGQKVRIDIDSEGNARVR